MADQDGAQVAGLHVLRISHSSVVVSWRSRERWLRALGLTVSLATARRWEEGGAVVALEPSPDEQVTAIRTIGRHPCGFLYEPTALWRVLQSVPHDLLDLHEEPYSLAAAETVFLRWLSRRRVPLVVYSAQNLQKRHPFPVRIAERAVLARAQGAYPCNEGAAANLRRKGFQGVVQVVPLGVDPLPESCESEIRPQSSVDNGASQFRLGCVGRLAVWKGFHVLIDAIAEEPGWQLRIAGEGPERLNLVDQAKRAGLAERVEFLGYCDAAQMARFYRSIDVLVVPSIPVPGLEEQFGRVVVEAMATGVPVVSTTTGSLPEVVGNAGVLVPPGDPEELRRTLVALSKDPELRQKLVEKGLVRSRSYSWEAVACQHLTLYRSVVASVPRDANGPAQELPALEVVVVAYGRPDLLAKALDGLCNNGPSDVPVLVVDNSSSPEIQRVVESHGARYVDPGINLGFARAVNLALTHPKTQDSDVLLLNPDAQVDPTTVRALQRRLHAESRLACVAPAQDSPDGEPQRVAWPFPGPVRSWLEAFGLAHLLDKPEFLVGSVLMINGAALREVGGFDEDFFLYAEETDWQRRARDAGWGNRLCDDLRARHIGAATSSQDPNRRELLFSGAQERYLRKWYGRSGWELARAAIVIGSLARALLLSGERRRAALDRARRFAAGPLRLMANEPGQP